MTTKFADMIGKVRGLLAKADSTDNPHEATALRDKAEALMFKHKIDMATATAEERREGGYAKPEWRTIDLCPLNSTWYHYYNGIAMAVIRHVDARAVVLRDDKAGNYVLRMVGFGADLDYVEMLLASAILAFGKRMEPKVDPNLSEAANAFNLRMGGMERHRIANALWGALPDEEAYTQTYGSRGYNMVRKPTNATKARNRKVTALIKAGAELAGEDPSVVLGQGNNIKTFRESYASGFYFTLVNRLTTLALNRGETDKGMVLASLEAQVEDMFYAEYPNLKPRPEKTGRANAVPPNETCDKCKKAKSGYCRDHQYLKPRTGGGRALSYNHEAANLGRSAARTVDLGPGGTAKAPAAPTRTELG